MLSQRNEGRTIVRLGDAQEIDEIVAEMRKGISDRHASFREQSRRAYQRIFAPFEKQIHHGSQILIAPDGALHFIPFEVLHDGTRPLLDQFDISYVTTGRDLVPLVGKPGASGPAVVVYAPDFDAGAGEKHPPGTSAVRDVLAEAAAPDASREMRGVRFKPLPGSADEGRTVAEQLKKAGIATEEYGGSAASEDALRRVKHPTVLHIATHGFFLDSKASTAGKRADGTRDIAGISAGLQKETRPPVRGGNPLLRSGLAFAGANRARGSAPGKDDGLATALELSGLDLYGTRLVVLSACNTGVGRVKAGEGVYGLRRAFLHAGARSIIMTLWKVHDKATCLLMERFYANWLGGMSKSEALRDAKRWLRDYETETPADGKTVEQPGQAATKAKPYAHPFYWAPFVLVGDWK